MSATISLIKRKPYNNENINEKSCDKQFDFMEWLVFVTYSLLGYCHFTTSISLTKFLCYTFHTLYQSKDICTKFNRSYSKKPPFLIKHPWYPHSRHQSHGIWFQPNIHHYWCGMPCREEANAFQIYKPSSNRFIYIHFGSKSSMGHRFLSFEKMEEWNVFTLFFFCSKCFLNYSVMLKCKNDFLNCHEKMKYFRHKVFRQATNFTHYSANT